MTVDANAIKTAQDRLNAHLKEIIQWHFSPETGCPFWRRPAISAAARRRRSATET